MRNSVVHFNLDNPPAIVKHRSGKHIEIKKIDNHLNKDPILVLMDYMSKSINRIDKARKEFREKYPALFK